MSAHLVSDGLWPDITHDSSGFSTGDKRGGATRVLYDTTTSERGALLAVGRAPRQASMFDVGLPLVIKTPHALPMFREDTGRKRSRDMARQVGHGTLADQLAQFTVLLCSCPCISVH
jgi:hypothetical protein